MWEITLSGQVTGFLFSLALGALLAVFYDFIRAARDAGLNSFVAVFIGDLLFFIISALTVFIYLVGTTNGQVRGYILFSAAVGFMLYRITVGKAVYFFVSGLFKYTLTVFRRLSEILLKTVLFCQKPVGRFLVILNNFSTHIFKIFSTQIFKK